MNLDETKVREPSLTSLKGYRQVLSKLSLGSVPRCFSIGGVLVSWSAACLRTRPAMEPWPTLAWVLLITLVADWSKTAQSRDFTKEDVIFLYPSTTPFPGGFKCFTCENATDNYECNRWAPDVYCPQGTRYCYTQHGLSKSGDSTFVTKRCVSLEDCLHTGCTDNNLEGQKVCTSCCEGPICNLSVPSNETDAIFATLSPLSSAPAGSHSYVPVLCVTLNIMLGLTAV